MLLSRSCTDFILIMQSETVLTKFGASVEKDQFARVKALTTDLITRLQAESSSETSHKSYL